MSKDLIIQNMAVSTDDYNQLIDNISSLWTTAKEKAINAVNTELLEPTGRRANILWSLNKVEGLEPNMASS